MKLKNIISFLLVLVFLFQIKPNAQTVWDCKTTGPSVDFLKNINVSPSNPVLQSVIIKIFIHVINRTNGTGGLNSTQVSNVITILSNHYLGRNIYFEQIGSDNINSDTYYNFSGDAQFNSLISINSHTDAIDIYLLPTSVIYGGRAAGIPAIALVVDGNNSQNPIISHEMGHCLGLWHTHHGTYNEGGSDPNQCAEIPLGV